jgi:hypothetical protein
LGLALLFARGATVEKIWWADRAAFAGIAAPFGAGLALCAMGSLTGTTSTVYLGFTLIFAFAAFFVAVILPVALIVVRIRKRKGWLSSIAGKQPVTW